MDKLQLDFDPSFYRKAVQMDNVYFYRKREGESPIWEKILPTPVIERLEEDEKLKQSGISQERS